MITPPPPETRLRCLRREDVVILTPDEMLRVSRRGEWPGYCVLPMVLEVEDQAVSPNGKTDLERLRRR
jgi:hypothetical protein